MNRYVGAKKGWHFYSNRVNSAWKYLIPPFQLNFLAFTVCFVGYNANYLGYPSGFGSTQIWELWSNNVSLSQQNRVDFIPSTSFPHPEKFPETQAEPWSLLDALSQAFINQKQ